MRKHQRTKSQNSVSKFFISIFEPKRLIKHPSEVDAEALTKEERLSRLLYTPKLPAVIPSSGPFIEHFLVIGQANHSAEPPSVLFRFPYEKEVNLPGIEDFCFPNGVTEIAKSFSVFYNYKKPENAFVFLLTDEHKQSLYGICVHNYELFDEETSFVKGNKSIVYKNDKMRLTKRCYCIISKFPYFRLHLDFIYYLLSMEEGNKNFPQRKTKLNKSKEEVTSSPSPPSSPRSSSPIPSLLSVTSDPISPRKALFSSNFRTSFPSTSPRRENENDPLSVINDFTNRIYNLKLKQNNNKNDNKKDNNNKDNNKDNGNNNGNNNDNKSHSRSNSNNDNNKSSHSRNSSNNDNDNNNKGSHSRSSSSNDSNNNDDNKSNHSRSNSNNDNNNKNSHSRNSSNNDNDNNINGNNDLNYNSENENKEMNEDKYNNLNNFNNFNNSIYYNDNINDSSDNIDNYYLSIHLNNIKIISEDLKEENSENNENIEDNNKKNNHINNELNSSVYNNLFNDCLFSDDENNNNNNDNNNNNNNKLNNLSNGDLNNNKNDNILNNDNNNENNLNIENNLKNNLNLNLSSINNNNNNNNNIKEENDENNNKNIEKNHEKKEKQIENKFINEIERYQKLILAKGGQKIRFQCEKGDQIHFQRPFFDEEEEIMSEWAIPLLFTHFSFSFICNILSAILLEKKIIFVSSNLRFLSSFVLAIPPLIRPFVYQSVIITTLPKKMSSFLEAPVPFIVGVTSLPPDLPNDVIVVDFTKKPNPIRSLHPIPPLPNFPHLKGKISHYVDQLSKGGRETTPYHTTRDQVYLIESISTIMENYFSSLFANFHNYTIRDLTDPANPISVFIKESFLCDTHDTSFFAPFLSSQIFFHYSDKRLRKRDDIVKLQFDPGHEMEDCN